MQPFAQAVRVDRRRAVFLLQRNQDVAIGGADRRGVAKRQVGAAEGNPDVVDDRVDFALRNGLPDFVLDRGEVNLGLFQAGSRGRARVQAHLSRIHRGEEIAADQRSAEGAFERQVDMAERPDADVGGRGVMFHFRVEHVVRHGDHQGPRQKIGGHHREDHRQRHGREQELRGAG